MNERVQLSQIATVQSLAGNHPDPHVSRRLPYHFAKARGIMAVRQQDNVIELWVRDDMEAASLAEARRILRRLSPKVFRSPLQKVN